MDSNLRLSCGKKGHGIENERFYGKTEKYRLNSTNYWGSIVPTGDKMKTLTLTQIVKTPSLLRKALKESKDQKVRIIWKEAKPNGILEDSAIVYLERKDGFTDNCKK